MISKNGVWAPHGEAQAKDLGGMTRRVLAHGDDLMVVENTAEAGCVGAPHAHPHTQAVYIVSGAYEFDVAGEKRTVRGGDSLFVAGGVEHGCKCLEAGVFIDVFTPMREDFV